MATSITITGRTTKDPELRFTAGGAAVANLSVAVNHRKKGDSGEWEDAGTDFYEVTAWKQLGENVAASITKGMSVVVVGRLRSRTYETREGEKRTVWEVEADEVSPSLRFATVSVERAQGQPGGGYGQGAGWGQQQPQQSQRRGQQQNDPWGQQTPSEPPF